ncbi:MAG: hypothetical protein RIR00_1165 [Pseudomonadota bacterium]
MKPLILFAALSCAVHAAWAAPVVSRLTPPSNAPQAGAMTLSRFLPGQKFDLQATVRPDAGQRIASFEFAVDGVPVSAAAAVKSLVTTGLVKDLPAGTAVVSLRGYALSKPGLHSLSVSARQSDGQIAQAQGQFEIVALERQGRPVKNIIFLLGDGMGASHRTAARIMAAGYAQGKAQGKLAMDSLPYTGMVMTSSLNSIVTDSAPGMSNYVTGNKAANNQEGVFPDDTLDPFDNPRVEYLSEYLHRTQGKNLGIVTTADVFDATPAANAVHTASRGAGTGIVDQFLDDRHLTGLSVLMGGGRKWFIPRNAAIGAANPLNVGNGSVRSDKNDYLLPPDVVAGWGAAPGARDPERDLIADFQQAGFAYASDKTSLDKLGVPAKLLGLFAYSNMNVALDKIAGRRGQGSVVADFGFPDQPMLDEMAEKAIQVLQRHSPKGFFLMIEGASIDKQAHLMDSDRWIMETLEFDRAVKVARDFAAQDGNTLVIVTADHECAGAAIIGAAKVSQSQLQAWAGTGAANQRDKAVGVYEDAGFPHYQMAGDGYPLSTDIDGKMLIGYGANADRYETWLTSHLPTQDGQQPFIKAAPLNTHPAHPGKRNEGQGFLITGQVPGDQAVHTATDVPLSAFGRGAAQFTGVYDNTDVFFKMGQAVVGGVK